MKSKRERRKIKEDEVVDLVARGLVGDLARHMSCLQEQVDQVKRQQLQLILNQIVKATAEVETEEISCPENAKENGNLLLADSRPLSKFDMGKMGKGESLVTRSAVAGNQTRERPSCFYENLPMFIRCVQGVPVNAKKKEVVDSKAGGKGKIVKNTATPKKLIQPAGSTSAGKVVMKRTHAARAFKRKTVLNQPLALRSKAARIGFQQQVSTASALLALQKLRTSGTWVRCSLQQCGKWRKLKEMDPSEVKNHPLDDNLC